MSVKIPASVISSEPMISTGEKEITNHFFTLFYSTTYKKKLYAVTKPNIV